MSFLFVLGGLFVWLFFNGAFTSLGTRWSSHNMATQYWNWYFISVSSVCLWAVPKKNQWNLWPLCPEISFFVSLSLLQLPTCLACLQCHRMAQILTLGKISPKPFYLLPTANTYMCDTTNSTCLMVEYSLTFIIKTLQHWLCYMYSWILQIRSWNVSE